MAPFSFSGVNKPVAFPGPVFSHLDQRLAGKGSHPGARKMLDGLAFKTEMEGRGLPALD
jgi:hypothetical protein